MSAPVPSYCLFPEERHVIVTKFAVPYEDPAASPHHADPEWLEERLELFHRFYVPSVGRLGVPVVLLVSTEARQRVEEGTAGLDWVHLRVQDEWRGSWTAAPGQTLTRLDSDDAVHEGWLTAVDAAPADAQVVITKSFLRLDPRSRRLHRYRRSEPSPLAAFRQGQNPYAHDHKHLERHYRTHEVTEPHLLQVVHGSNLSNRPPRFWRLDRRVGWGRLEPFGVTV